MVDADDRGPELEGWFEGDYIVIFAESDIALVSQQYNLSKYLPGFEVIGIAAWDDLIVRDSNHDTYRVPSVPILIEHLHQYSVPTNALDVESDERFVGKVKWYVMPIVLGGSPTDDENMVWVSFEQHPEVVVWWNEKYRETVRLSSDTE